MKGSIGCRIRTRASRRSGEGGADLLLIDKFDRQDVK
jgi:hypothetical protein